jgi:hypothetical protein
MALFGAVVGSILDGFHTHSGTTRYPDPWIWQMAWWTPLIFAGAYLALGLAYEVGATWAGRPIGSSRWQEMLGFCGLYFLSGYLPASNPIKLAMLVAGGLTLWAIRDRSPATLAVGLLSAVLGPATEIALVHYGVFSHLQPDFAGIPMWLPGLYFASAPAGCFVAWLGSRGARRADIQGAFSPSLLP